MRPFFRANPAFLALILGVGAGQCWQILVLSRLFQGPLNPFSGLVAFASPGIRQDLWCYLLQQLFPIRYHSTDR
ncbi:hypothetical protein LZ30DRAFT_706641 [Colletotrichum cereale]|nr:hypothetical protein LZ30DRAFT_706641 [Colletotrichum cereale]